MQDKSKAIINEIKTAFAHIPRPKDGEWYEVSYPDPEIIESIFIGQKLDNITLKQVWNQGDVLSWLKPPAILYLLPKLAQLCLEDPDEAGDLFDAIEFTFIKPGTGFGYSRNKETIAALASLMDQAMRRAICRFFEVFYEIYPGGGEPREYWLGS